MKTLTLETIILTYWGDIYMKRFFKLLRNVLLLALIALGVCTYQNNPNIRIATQDSLATLSYRINELLTNETTISPNNEKKTTNIKTDTDKTENDDSSDNRVRSEEHTSELQSRFDLVCRLLLEKKKNKITYK